MSQDELFERVQGYLQDFAEELGVKRELLDGQLLLNASVAIQNAYQGYDEGGNFVGVRLG